jgi:hypothetical protein
MDRAGRVPEPRKENEMVVNTSAKKLKVTAVIDAAPFAALRVIPDNAPSRVELAINIGGRSFTAGIATKSVRKAVKTLSENGADNVVLIIQGALNADGKTIDDAGLAATVKAPAAVPA